MTADEFTKELESLGYINLLNLTDVEKIVSVNDDPETSET